MLPALSNNDASNNVSRACVFSGQHMLRNHKRNIFSFDFSGSGLCYFCKLVFASTRNPFRIFDSPMLFAAHCMAVGLAVFIILFDCSGPEMRRIYAFSVTARVKAQGQCIFSIVQKVRDAMGLYLPLTHSERSVATKKSPLPHPAISERGIVGMDWPALVNLLPKSTHIIGSQFLNWDSSCHKRKTARQSKCACGSLPERANWKVGAGSCSTSASKISSPHGHST